MRNNVAGRSWILLGTMAMGLGATATAARADVLTGYTLGETGTLLAFDIYNTNVVGQTFQVPTAGIATSADLYLGAYDASDPLTVSIYATTPSINGPQPTGVPLATSTVPASDINFFLENRNFLFAAPATLLPDVEYALVASTTASATNEYQWDADQLETGVPYAYGNVIEASSIDSTFYPNPPTALQFDIQGTALPEPASLTLFALTPFLLRRRRPTTQVQTGE